MSNELLDKPRNITFTTARPPQVGDRCVTWCGVDQYGEPVEESIIVDAETFAAMFPEKVGTK